MLGLFKKDYGCLNHERYRRLAVAAIKISAVTQEKIVGEFRRGNDPEAQFIFVETLAFATCLIQMRAQSAFKLDSPVRILEIIANLQAEYVQFSSTEEFEIQVAPTIGKTTMEMVGAKAFVERACFYSSRNYKSLGISDELFTQFCEMTNVNLAIIRGAGANLALVIFQAAVFCFIGSDHSISPDVVNSYLQFTRISKEMIIEQADRLLK
jgi:hypothetical protein